MADSGARKYDVFISYSHGDRKFSEELAKSLRSLDLLVWFDLWSIKPGERWRDTIEHALDTETALFVIGRDGIEKWQSAELQATLAKSMARILMFALCLYWLPDQRGRPYRSPFVHTGR